MKEIGEQFKEKREEIGITIAEVSDDLKVDSLLLENLEEGNSKVFKDVLEMKELIITYAKYLGLEDEKIVDEFNDYLFEKTSKISLEDIKASVKKTPVVEKKIKSPYTIEIKPEKDKSIVLIIALVVILLAILYFILRKIYLG